MERKHEAAAILLICCGWSMGVPGAIADNTCCCNVAQLVGRGSTQGLLLTTFLLSSSGLTHTWGLCTLSSIKNGFNVSYRSFPSSKLETHRCGEVSGVQGVLVERTSALGAPVCPGFPSLRTLPNCLPWGNRLQHQTRKQQTQRLLSQLSLFPLLSASQKLV